MKIEKRPPNLENDFCAQALSVSEVVRIIRNDIELDERLQGLWVCGEISNYTLHRASGHIYFSLKDQGAQLRVVFFRDANIRLKDLELRDGLEVQVFGRVGVYEKSGAVQLYAEDVRQKGVGDLFLAFQRLKEKLQAEGLFDRPGKPLPPFPGKIGIITSETAAALQDVLNVLRRRYPCLELILAPALVQGERAPKEIIAALKRLNQVPDLDLILMVRGGGSIEDLWAFNDEGLARAIAASRLPVVTGIGHEIDFTIADFVADLRAPTPSAAAEMVTPDRQDLLSSLDSVAAKLFRALKNSIHTKKVELKGLMRSRFMRAPAAAVETGKQQLDDVMSRMLDAAQRDIKDKMVAADGLRDRIRALNPLAVIERGYVLCLDPESGDAVTGVKTLEPGARLDVRFHDGKALCEVESVTVDTDLRSNK